MRESEHKKPIKGYIRIKDKHGHFLGEIRLNSSFYGSFYAYCKRCKEFHYCCKAALEEGGIIDGSKEDIRQDSK